MKRVRVLVANQPRLMRELVVSTLADQSDIELVGEVEHPEQIVRTVEQVRPDVLILAMDKEAKFEPLCGFLLAQFPGMRILTLAPEQNRACLHWASVDIRSTPFESSEAGILGAMRQSSPLGGMAQV